MSDAFRSLSFARAKMSPAYLSDPAAVAMRTALYASYSSSGERSSRVIGFCTVFEPSVSAYSPRGNSE